MTLKRTDIINPFTNVDLDNKKENITDCEEC